MIADTGPNQSFQQSIFSKPCFKVKSRVRRLLKWTWKDQDKKKEKRIETDINLSYSPHKIVWQSLSGIQDSQDCASKKKLSGQRLIETNARPNLNVMET